MSRSTVIFLQVIAGAVKSLTVTVEVHVAELLAASLTRSVTVFAPTFEQVNELGETEITEKTQLS